MLDLLPDDIILIICEQLCCHCQQPSVFPDGGNSDASAGKLALARLCRTSKRCYNLAQPVLYHYYATGNIPLKFDLVSSTVSAGRIHDDKLVQFLRTIGRREDLAGQVKALQLAGCALGNGTDNTAVENMHSLLTECDHSRNPIVEARLRLSGNPSTSEMRRWLMQVAITLCANIEMLYIAHTAPSRFFTDTKVTLPRLWSLAIRGYSGQYYFSGVARLIAAATNLRDLYLLDCSYSIGWTRIVQSSTEVAFSRLIRLVVTNLGTEELRDLLRQCHQLQHLEYYRQGSASIWNVSDIVQSFTPVRDTLRRLYFSCLPLDSAEISRTEIEGAQPAIPLGRYVEDAFTVSHDTSAIHRLREFTKLEELGLDQVSIFSPSSTDPDSSPGRLCQLLPPTLQKLRVMYVYRGMANDMLALVQQADFWSPCLRNVRLGEALTIAPWRQAGMDEMKRACADFLVRGPHLSVSWTVDRPGADAHTRIPVATLHQQELLCPVE